MEDTIVATLKSPDGQDLMSRMGHLLGNSPPDKTRANKLAMGLTDVVRTVDPADAKNLGPLGRRETEGVRLCRRHGGKPWLEAKDLRPVER
jgi:hypothetical protein